MLCNAVYQTLRHTMQWLLMLCAVAAGVAAKAGAGHNTVPRHATRCAKLSLPHTVLACLKTLPNTGILFWRMPAWGAHHPQKRCVLSITTCNNGVAAASSDQYNSHQHAPKCTESQLISLAATCWPLRHIYTCTTHDQGQLRQGLQQSMS